MLIAGLELCYVLIVIGILILAVIIGLINVFFDKITIRMNKIFKNRNPLIANITIIVIAEIILILILL